MAKHDVRADTTPALQFPNVGKFPTVSALRTAISGSGVSASYPTATLEAMTKNDLIFVCRSHAIACVGL